MDKEQAEFEIIKEKPDGGCVMLVNGVEFGISPQSLPDAEWELKLQAKANLFAQMVEQ